MAWIWLSFAIDSGSTVASNVGMLFHRTLMALMPLMLYPKPDGTHIIRDATERRAIGLPMRFLELHWIPKRFESEEQYTAMSEGAHQMLLELAAILEKVRVLPAYCKAK